MSDLNLRYNKGKYRRSLDIVRDILTIATLSVKKTHIMYQANLSYLLVNKYINQLLTRDLLRLDGGSCYLITKRGMEFLKLHDDYVRRCTDIKYQIDQAKKDRRRLEKICFGKECER